EGFNQLNKPADICKWSHCMPVGIILSISMQSATVEYYFLSVVNKHKQTIHRCRKLCCDAQELIIFYVDKYGEDCKQDNQNWIFLDVKVGCWLLDPDHPPNRFIDALDILGIDKCDMKKTACFLLLLQSCAAEKLYHKLKQHDLWKLFIDIEMKLLPIIAEVRCICVDKQKLNEMGNILEEQINVLEEEAYKSAGKRFQLNSIQQLSKILYDELKLDQKANVKVKPTSSLGLKSTSISASHHTLPGVILEYRHLQKLKSTYIDAMLQHVKGNCIFTTWEQTAAATGRLTSSNPNLQSVPKQPLSISSLQKCVQLRSAFIARPGYVFLGADFQHIEFRVFAHLAKDKSLSEMFQQPEDIFITLARLWLGKNGEKISLDEREKTKRIVYAVIYGAGAAKLTEFLKITEDEARNIITSFNGICPVLQRFRQQVLMECQKLGYLITIGGRRRNFPNINSCNSQTRYHTERQAINFIIQGSAADLCKLAMLQVEQKLAERNLSQAVHLVLQIHDELLWEVNIENIIPVQGKTYDTSSRS
ncbi:hypothetical protein L9F63_012559, partial [Diploptera punctata]